jgi:hypothetical protein
MLRAISVVAYTRLRMLWGGFDWQHGTDNPYTTAQTQNGGTSAVAGAGNVGVRRVVCTLDRSLNSPADDVMQVHFDFLNQTSGAPDDTWTSSDYTTIETALDAFWTSYATFMATKTRLTQYSWYRVGTGITPPNPAQRVLVKPTPIAGVVASPASIPQTAFSLTFRTAVRRSWGRTYLPYAPGMTGAEQRISSGNVDSIVGYANTLVTACASSDFHLVVTSLHLSASLNVEKLEGDDVMDVVRRRRWKHTSYRKILP